MPSRPSSPPACGPAPGRRALLGGAAALALPCLGVAPAAAQSVRIDVAGVGAAVYPIAIPNFAADTRAPVDVAQVVRTNLTRSGSFRLIDAPGALSDSATPDFAGLRGRGADTVAGGSVSRLADGRYDVRFRLHDVVRGSVIGGEAFVALNTDLRYAAHRISDWIHQKVTGERGIFATRIVYVSRAGGRWRLNVADWDGENVMSPLSSAEPVMSPCWSPDGSRLAYVSFESGKPVVYVHTLATGQRREVANFRGSNSAPAWSPDGRVLAVSLTREGLSQVFLLNADGSGSPRRLTTSPGIDTEPAFTPDGRGLYFTSDRGGSPQIYRMPIEGGEPARITFNGSYNVSARPSPDGRSIAFVTRREGRYLASGNEQVLSDGGREESPSFAPNGRWVMFATQAGGRDALMAVTTDGRVKHRLGSSQGDIREPSWGPFSS